MVQNVTLDHDSNHQVVIRPFTIGTSFLALFRASRNRPTDDFSHSLLGLARVHGVDDVGQDLCEAGVKIIGTGEKN